MKAPSTLAHEFNHLMGLYRVLEQDHAALKIDNAQLRNRIKVQHEMIMARDDKLRGLAQRVNRLSASQSAFDRAISA